MQPSSVPAPRPVRFLVFVLTLGSVLTAGSANAQPAAPVGQTPDRSRMRAARVLEELQRRGCDTLPAGEVGQICVDDALAAVYPFGFSIQLSSSPHFPASKDRSHWPPTHASQ